MSQVRTRFAPSPTGFLHVGGLRTALYSYAFAKSKGGKFLLRIEDTDVRRVVPGAVEGIYQMLDAFGLCPDEGPLAGGPHKPYIQSERVKLGIYQKYAEKLVKDGYAYYCDCPPEDIKEIKKRQKKGQILLRDRCRDKDPKEMEKKIKVGEKLAIRLRVPDKRKVCFFDFVLKKEICWETQNIDEVMLLKSDGFPTYHLAVVVDDVLMNVSHIIRGRDWLASTPVHVLLFKYLGFPLPEIGHLTDILDPLGGKLSKRKGSVSCEELIADGYLPEAILNFIMLLGWASKDDRELFTLEEFVEYFQKGNLHVANPVFDRKKLDWFNGVYIRKKTDRQLLQLLKPFVPKGMSVTLIEKTIPLVKDRLFKLSDYPDLIDFFIKEPKLNKKLLIQKGGKDKKLIKEEFEKAVGIFKGIKNWRAEDLEKSFRDLATKQSYHVGKFFMALRIAITSKTATPPLFETMEVLGREKTLKRLILAIKKF
ncbi:MAG TPA: glutamate--tRNA ligase [Nevskiaceae bacterium]|nr:glutamate--tRNA ligase [Nevskiaceae bacterium]